MKDPRKWWLRRIQPNKKRAVLEQGGAVARVLRESGINPSPLSMCAGGQTGDSHEAGRESGEGAVEGEAEGTEATDEDADESARVLRPRASTGSEAQPEAAEGAQAAGSGSDTDGSEDAYRPEADPDPESDAEGGEAPSSTAQPRPGKHVSSKRAPAPAAPAPSAPPAAPPVSRRRGPYIRRDMRNAIQGAGLLALGVLVEEMIRAQLAAAGYAPRARERRASTAVESDVEPASDPEADP